MEAHTHKRKNLSHRKESPLIQISHKGLLLTMKMLYLEVFRLLTVSSTKMITIIQARTARKLTKSSFSIKINLIMMQVNLLILKSLQKKTKINRLILYQRNQQVIRITD